jgi:hypothetical protein
MEMRGDQQLIEREAKGESEVFEILSSDFAGILFYF